VAGYLLGEYSHLLARRPGCSPKEVFHIVHDKFPTVTTPTKAILLSAYVKILMHTQPLDQELQVQVEEVFKRFVSFNSFFLIRLWFLFCDCLIAYFLLPFLVLSDHPLCCQTDVRMLLMLKYSSGLLSTSLLVARDHLWWTLWQKCQSFLSASQH
jgi:hypothetical protein